MKRFSRSWGGPSRLSSTVSKLWAFYRQKKFVVIGLVAIGVVWLLGPALLHWIWHKRRFHHDPLVTCEEEWVRQVRGDVEKYDVVVSRGRFGPQGPYGREQSGSQFPGSAILPRTLLISEASRYILPYVGNGYIGLEVSEDGQIYVKSGRYLGAALPFKPVATLSVAGTAVGDSVGGTGAGEERRVSDDVYITKFGHGLVEHFKCYMINAPSEETHGTPTVDVMSTYMAHRTIPGLLIQDVKILNPTDASVFFNVYQTGMQNWPDPRVTRKMLAYGDGDHEYVIASGVIPDGAGGQLAVSIAFPKLASGITVDAKGSVNLRILTAVSYRPLADDKSVQQSVIEITKKEVIEVITEAVSVSYSKLHAEHVEVWRNLWTSGFFISRSLAEGALNGDKINSTMYYVMSHSPAPIHWRKTTDVEKQKLFSELFYAEGCYGDHQTLIESASLWGDLKTLSSVNRIVYYWLTTLEKKGCHKLIAVGADGVIRAMVLSFGAFKYSNHHLEFRSPPKDLHRDSTFRHLAYGNGTFLTVSVVIRDDNKPWLWVALDAASTAAKPNGLPDEIWACDAGCLDRPVQLSTKPQMFPVKLTDPFTAILYITADKGHIEELKHTIHVHEINEAPAHEQHVLSLHRHGHYLGGLPTTFWIAITFLVVIFHLFLFKLVYNEYCGRVDGGGEGALSAASSKRSAAAALLAAATASSERFRARKYSDF